MLTVQGVCLCVGNCSNKLVFRNTPIVFSMCSACACHRENFHSIFLFYFREQHAIERIAEYIMMFCFVFDGGGGGGGSLQSGR